MQHKCNENKSYQSNRAQTKAIGYQAMTKYRIKMSRKCLTFYKKLLESKPDVYDNNFSLKSVLAFYL